MPKVAVHTGWDQDLVRLIGAIVIECAHMDLFVSSCLAHTTGQNMDAGVNPMYARDTRQKAVDLAKASSGETSAAAEKVGDILNERNLFTHGFLSSKVDEDVYFQFAVRGPYKGLPQHIDADRANALLHRIYEVNGALFEYLKTAGFWLPADGKK